MCMVELMVVIVVVYGVVVFMAVVMVVAFNACVVYVKNDLICMTTNCVLLYSPVYLLCICVCVCCLSYVLCCALVNE